MHAVLASLRFHPGHVSHLMANARLLEEAGYSVSFRWHPQFSEMLSLGGKIRTETTSSLTKLGPSAIYILWFPSFAGFLDVLLLRLLRRPVRLVYVLHEPYTSYRSHRDAGFSPAKAFRVYLIHLINSAILRLSNGVILPSSNAQMAFRQRYRERGLSVQVVPLMFDDEAVGGVPGPVDRRYVSYIGTIAEDHAFNRFVDFVENALKQNLLEEVQFQLVTRSTPDDDTLRRFAPFIASGRLHLQCGRPLSNEEINQAFRRSLVVWNAYTRSMQSGVLPKAYMFGTPVLISDANPSEFFQDGTHGVCVSTRYDPLEMAAAVKTIEQQFEQMSAACRSAFLKHFHYRASAARFLAVLN